MLRKILILVVSLVIVILIARLPIFPLISEMREITQDGESLSQTWSFVSMPEFYAAAQFAKVGWLNSTWNNYLILAVVNHVALILAFFGVRNLLTHMFQKNQVIVMFK